MQILTASWITNEGFATWLTPKVKITNLSTGDVSEYTMEEVGNGNYKYIFNDYKDSVVYFFNYDSWSEDTLNRYMSSSNNDVRVVYQQTTAWGTNASMNEEKKKEEKLIKKIADEVEKRMEEKLEKDIIKNIQNYIQEKHKETLGQFVWIWQTSDIEMLSWGIDHLEAKTSLKIEKIEKAIKSIKIPKYDDTKVKALIEKVLTQMEEKGISIEESIKGLLILLEWSKSELKEEIKQRTKKPITEKDIKAMEVEALENTKEFQMLKLMATPEFISLMEMNE